MREAISMQSETIGATCRSASRSDASWEAISMQSETIKSQSMT